MSKKFFLIPALILSIITVMTSCYAGAFRKTIFTGHTDKATSTVSPDKATPTIYIPETPARPDCIIWWESGSAAQNLLNQAIKDFYETYPEYKNYTIKSVSPASMDKNDLEMAIASHTHPDIVRMDHSYLSYLGMNGDIENLANPEFNFNKHQSEYIPSTWNLVRFKDKIFGIPFDSSTIVLLVNKSLMSSAGINYIPKSYQQIMDSGKAIADLNMNNTWGYTVRVYDPHSSWNGTNMWLTYLWRMGGDILSPDLTKAVFNQQPGIDALKMWVDMSKQRIYDPKSYHEGSFLKGSIGMIDAGPNFIEAVSHVKDINFEFTTLPVLKEGIPNYSGLGVYALAVLSKKTGNIDTDISYKFAEYLGTGAKYQTTYCKAFNVLPTLYNVFEDPYFNDDAHIVFRNQTKVAKTIPNVECWSAINDILILAVSEAVSGEKSPKQALDDAAKLVNKILNNSYQ